MMSSCSQPAEEAPAIDYAGFERELVALRAEIAARIGPDDLAHLKKMERWGRTCTAVGYVTAWIAPNPVSASLISLGNTARWTIVAHHVTHRGLDAVPGVPARYASRRFAKGARRLVDWLDWMLPEAWRYEHNVLHHHHTGEDGDPDLVEENARAIRESSLPLPLKYAAVAFYACTWKLTYYAPSTFLVFARSRSRDRAKGAPAAAWRESDGSIWDPFGPEGRAFWWQCVLPYAAVRFGALPALFLPLGPVAWANVLANSIAAEVLTNVHTFLLIAPNHAGGDLFRFEGRPADRAERCVRQVVGSTNYPAGGDVRDFLHGCLNYQIEHHLWPDLPPLRYQELAPRVKALCARYGLPYRQEGVLRRAAKAVEVMVGRASMRRMGARPRPRRERPAVSREARGRDA